MTESKLIRHLLLVSLSTLAIASCGDSNPHNEENDGEEESLVIASDLSNQKVNAIAEDAQGYIWIGTFRGLNKYNVHEYHQYFCTDDSINLPDNQITDLYRDSKGRLWVATVNGLCLYTDHDNFKHIPQNYNNRNGVQLLETRDGRILLSSLYQLAVYDQDADSLNLVIKTLDPEYSFIAKCFIDQNNRLWVANSTYLRCYNTSTFAKIYEIKLPITSNYSFMQTDGTLWITGDGKVVLFDTYTRQFKETPAAIRQNPTLAATRVNLMHPYGDNCLLISTEHNNLMLYSYTNGRLIDDSDNDFPFDPPHANITRMLTDSQGNLWIGTEDQGYTVRYRDKDRFNTDHFLTQSLKRKSITSIDYDKKQNMWFGTLSDGLYVYNMATKSLRNIPVRQLLDDVKFNRAKETNVFVDSNDNIWVRMNWNNKVFKCTYNETSLHIEKTYDIFLPMSMTQDEHGTIYVGTSFWKVYAMRHNEKDFTPIDVFEANGGTFIPSLLPIGDNRLWVMAFMRPVTELNTLTRKTRKAAISEQDWHDCIRRSVFIPTASLKDSKGDIWIGTVANGLLHYTAKTKRLRRVTGAPCKDISSIEEDMQGNLWIGTEYGLGKWDRSTGKFTNYYASDGIGGNQFYDRSSCRLPDGVMVFGGTHGLTMFNPIETGAKRNIPLLFEDLKIHNKLVRPGDGQPIDKQLSYKPDIHLRHNQNGFGISFSALNYRENGRVHYFYKMDGFDKYWIDAHNNREAYYANIPAGRYTFRVKVTNNDQNIVEVEDSIHVTVSPAPWMSWWACCLYLIAALAIIGLLLKTRSKILHEKEATKQAEREKEQEQRINKMNMSFFANISHEFRTPLTTIAGPIAQLCNSPHLAEDDRHMLNIVGRSVKRMLRLVNQMLDFNKLENDTLRLQVCRTDAISLLKDYADSFSINAKEKGVTLTTSGIEDAFIMWLDADKLDKIVVNLLSNALKFTPKGGNIELDFDADGTHAKITVTDTGCGIPEDQKEKIFERYYQLNNQPNATHNTGTGIGLYYSRSLAKLHHGSLTASNRQDGSGAVFTLLLPTSDDAYAENERVQAEPKQAEMFPIENIRQHDDAHTVKDAGKRPSLLIVDDDTDVVYYLKTLLGKQYHVTCCFDAKSALKTMGERTTDLVVSDVAMPDTNGYELCRQIKEDLQLCYIPVILVTAKATMKNQVEGLNTGADAYVTKPFDPNYLLALVSSLLRNREKIRSMLMQSTQTDKMDEGVLSPQDHAFMTELYQILESELANTELDIAHMTKRLGISRTKFYYRVKGLTGVSPSVFFKTYKLNRAAELIRDGKNTISEIAYMTGFSTLAHFSTVFKKQFGVAPSEYAK